MARSFNYKNILNEIARNNSEVRPLTDEESAHLKKCLLEMAVDLDERCRRNGIRLFLVGGSLLGAVRHKGFIPWDDDLDLGLIRDDYELLKRIFDDQFGDAYEIRCPNSDHPNGNRFMQIFKKGTVLKTVGNNNPLQPQSVFIDIFPYDFVPANRITRKIRGTAANALMFISSCVMDERYMSSEFRKYLSKSRDGKLFLRLRKTTGKFFGFLSPEKWFDTVDNVIDYGKFTGMITSATGRRHYFGELYEFDTFFPLTELDFEGHMFYAPNNYNRYLTGNYGDSYMKIPEKVNRESHFITELQIGD